MMGWYERILLTIATLALVGILLSLDALRASVYRAEMDKKGRL